MGAVAVPPSDERGARLVTNVGCRVLPAAEDTRDWGG